ncbi:MAG: hypothetical protein M3439_08855 [Chloroflexota bacterium]|nr:hypothetical protein [Chloroflexota bacterium]
MMTMQVVFDGEVFRPKDPVDLQPNATYTKVLESDTITTTDEVEEYPLTAIARLVTDMGVDDLSVNHDYYAHGRISEQ